MPDLVVVNTGPLIAWDRMGCLDIIGRLPLEFVCPKEVRDELVEGEKAGHPAIAPPWLGLRRLEAPPTSLGVVEEAGSGAVHPAPRRPGLRRRCPLPPAGGRGRAQAVGSGVDGVVSPVATNSERGVLGVCRVAAGQAPGLFGIARMERELAEAFGGRTGVDLRTPEDLSRHFRQSVLAEAEPLFEAAGTRSDP